MNFLIQTIIDLLRAINFETVTRLHTNLLFSLHIIPIYLKLYYKPIWSLDMILVHIMVSCGRCNSVQIIVAGIPLEAK